MEFCFGLFPTRGSKISWISQMLLCSMLCMWTTVESWSYFYSNTTMDWENARSWCREHYTDMVAIQNQDEIGHLNAWLPRQRNYYWIGIRKINDDWTWVGTNKTLTAEASSWAEGEPNNRKQKGSRESEDCVEMYIKRETQPGKWNDERCGKKKTALCFAAACKNDSCGYGDCVETINSHTCACFEGFYGEKCEKVVKCDKEKVTVPYKGSVKCTHKYGNFSFDSSCEYSCEEGYELSMSRPLRCTGSKEWSDQPPTCEAVQCPELSRPEGGSMDCFAPLGPSRYQTTCVFACDEGFVQAGSSSDTLQCEASGRWNATQPSCVAITCQNPEGAPHLITTCSSSSSELRLGSTCSFDCGAGFVLQGADNVQCAGDGRWSRAIPTCKEMECPAPEIPSSGRIFCSLPLSSSASPETPHPLGMVCNFTCDEGHELEGAPSMECDHPGQWSSSPPTCTVVKCDGEEVTVPYKGSVNCTHKYRKFSFDSSCEYSCEEGYELSMSRPLRCTGSKEWSDQPPTCEAVQCPELSRPEGGSMDCFAPLGPSRYQTTCVFACDEGFIQAGSSSDPLQCEASGRWNASQPSCVAITCQNPEGAPHLITKCSSSSSELRLGSTCSFDCGAGFVLQGADTVQCAGDGRWSRAIPTCKEMECPAPEIPSSGRIFCSLPLSSPASPETPHPLGMVCNFTCDEGHELEGAPSMECDHPGQWTSSPPTCTVVKCDREEVTVPYKGSVKCTHKYGNFSFDSSCEYSCEEGYELSMSRPLRCTGSKEWSDQPPTCEAVQCPELSRPEGGSMDCFAPLGPSRYQTTCVFACDEGFVQAGSSSDPLQCEASGRWNASQPSCAAITCQNPEGAPHLITTCSSSSSELRLGSTCSFDCGAGFVLQGADTVQCAGDGRWSRTIPTCKEMECPAPEIPSSGRIFCSLPLSSSASPETPHPLGMVCNFTCDEGHELEGAPSMECDHPGQWTSSPPTCTAVQCPELSRPEGGSMDCFAPLGPSRYQTTCVFSCDEGFIQAGSSSDPLQCEASGRWNATQPSCVALRCPSLEAPENGHINCSNSDPVFNTQCSFMCTPEYSLDGHDLLNCDRHGNWTGERPTCQASPSKLSAITSGVAAGGALLSGLSLAFWILKRLKLRKDTFELSSNSDIEAPPQVYKNSLDSLI